MLATMDRKKEREQEKSFLIRDEFPYGFAPEISSDSSYQHGDYIWIIWQQKNSFLQNCDWTLNEPLIVD